MTSQSTYIKTALRLPPELHKELAAAAKANGRSLNAEILTRLNASPALTLLEALTKQTSDIRNMTREILDTVSTK